MKKYFVLLLAAVFAFTALTGCSKSNTPSASGTPKTDFVVNNWEKEALANISSEKSLTISEFTAAIEGKSQINKGDLPNDKAYYATDRLNQEGYLIGDCFTLSCIYADNPENNLYSLKHFTNGTVDDETTKVEDFIKFVEGYTKDK